MIQDIHQNILKYLFPTNNMVKIDKKKCIGCGACVSACPEVFSMGEDGKAKVKSQKKASCVKKAIKSCPSHAISG